MGRLVRNTRSEVAFLTAAAFAVVAIALAARGTAVTARWWATHSLEVSIHLEGVKLGLSDSSRGAVAYMVTGNPAHLEDWEEGERRAWGDLEAVQTLTADNPEQQAKCAPLRAELTRRFLDLRDVVEAVKGGDKEAAHRYMNDGRGKRVMTTTVVLANDMMGEEDRLHLSRASRATAFGYVTFGLMLVGVSLGVGYAILSVRPKEKAPPPPPYEPTELEESSAFHRAFTEHDVN